MKWTTGVIYVIVPILVFSLSTYITLSVLLRGGGDVVCPDIRGKKVEDAKSLVESKGLGLHIVKYERKRDVPYNHITIQKPEAEMPIRKGRTVLVMVSEGPPLVEVPVLTGTSLEQATEALKATGLTVGKVIVVPSAKQGKIVAQMPKPGESVIEGKGITLLEGRRRSDWYLMPDVNDLNMAEFSEEMEGRRIKYKVSYTKGERFSPGMAMKTSVTPGTIFRAAEEIEIKVNSGG